jgi:hypothetical protein
MRKTIEPSKRFYKSGKEIFSTIYLALQETINLSWM